MKKSAIELIQDERERQVQVEGFDSAHDMEHGSSLLVEAAISYAYNAITSRAKEVPPDTWPWDSSWWKPKSRQRDLVRAVALIAAAIDVLDATENAERDYE